MTPTPYYASPDGRVTLYCGDCLAVMPQLEAGSVDAVVTDPPYGIRVAEWDEDRPPNSTWDSIAALLADGGVLYWWGFWGHADWVLTQGRRVGLFPQSRIVWWFRTGRPEKSSYREDTEEAWYFSKGTPRAFNAERYLEPYEDEANYARYGREGKHPGTVWQASRIFHNHPENVGHPTQKPLSLITKMVDISTLPSALVLDPFMGSGTTGVACVKTGRRFIGIEIDEGYCRIAQKRIVDALSQLPLVEAVP